MLATIHRPENTDDPPALTQIIDSLRRLPLPVLAALHPRTAAIHHAGLSAHLDGLTVIAPLAGPDFLGLAAESAILVSDSGGIQEEATVLGKPIIVVRRSTERPEAFKDHATLCDPAGILAAFTTLYRDLPALHKRLAAIPCPYGDGTASARIAAETLQRFGR